MCILKALNSYSHISSGKVYLLHSGQKFGNIHFPSLQQWSLKKKKKQKNKQTKKNLCFLVSEKYSPSCGFKESMADLLEPILRIFWDVELVFFYSIFLTARIILQIRMTHKKLPIRDSF